jgi:ABC-type uncharacterized transport system ATPase subunit
LSEQVQASTLSSFGSVVSQNEGQVVLDVPRERVATVAAEVLSQLPVADLAIEEFDIEEVVRTLFTEGNVSRGTSEAQVI